MMKISEIKEIFIRRGWSSGKDEVGDTFFSISIGDRAVEVIPSLKRTSNSVQFSPIYSVTTNEFVEAVSFIWGQNSGGEPIVSSVFEKESISVLKNEISPLDIESLIGRILEWAGAADVDGGLEKYRNLPTSAKGALPLRHLAALACSGDIMRLEYYQRKFSDGDRLGFVPYITKDMIDRAVIMAKKVIDRA